MFQDTMDPSRTVSIVAFVGKQARCRVYFEGRYSGNASLPASLFAPTPANERIGFTPVA